MLHYFLNSDWHYQSMLSHKILGWIHVQAGNPPDSWTLYSSAHFSSDHLSSAVSWVHSVACWSSLCFRCSLSTCPRPPATLPTPPIPHRKVNSTWGWARWASLGSNQEFQLNQGNKKPKFRLRFIFCPIISAQLLKYIC